MHAYLAMMWVAGQTSGFGSSNKAVTDDTIMIVILQSNQLIAIVPCTTTKVHPHPTVDRSENN